MPEITIAIPTRNRADLLRAALQSALAQPYGNIEIIVSDNCSDDGTATLLAGLSDPRIKVFRQEKLLSMHENWNFCLRMAAGEYFLLLSDDDLLVPGGLASLRAAFATPGVKLSYGRSSLISHEGKILGVTLPAPEVEEGSAFIKASLLGQRQALPCATMHYTTDALALGGYPEIGNVTDLALRLALAAQGKVSCAAGPVANYRLNPEGLTADAGKTIESLSLFSRWVSAGGPLADWKQETGKFCADWLFERAVSAALRGDGPSADSFATAAAGYSGKGLYYRTVLAICSTMPVRAIADRVRKFRASRRGGAS